MTQILTDWVVFINIFCIFSIIFHFLVKLAILKMEWKKMFFASTAPAYLYILSSRFHSYPRYNFFG